MIINLIKENSIIYSDTIFFRENLDLKEQLLNFVHKNNCYEVCNFKILSEGIPIIKEKLLHLLLKYDMTIISRYEFGPIGSIFINNKNIAEATINNEISLEDYKMIYNVLKSNSQYLGPDCHPFCLQFISDDIVDLLNIIKYIKYIMNLSSIEVRFFDDNEKQKYYI